MMQTVDNGVSLYLVVFSTTRNIECCRVVTERDSSIPFGNPPRFHGPPLAWNGSTFCVFRNFVLQKDSARASPPNLHGPKFMIDGRTPSDEGVRIYDSLLVCDDSPGGLSLDDHNLALFCVP